MKGIWRVSAALVLKALIGVAAVQPMLLDCAFAAEKPFADHHIALQISDDDPKKQSLVISIAYKLLEVYGPDSIDVEVVTFGPGIELLKADNPNRKKVDSLIAQGVKFDICGYTLETIQRETGSRPEMNPRATEVANGVPYLLSLSEKHYTIIRP